MAVEVPVSSAGYELDRLGLLGPGAGCSQPATGKGCRCSLWNPIVCQPLLLICLGPGWLSLLSLVVSKQSWLAVEVDDETRRLLPVYLLIPWELFSVWKRCVALQAGWHHAQENRKEWQQQRVCWTGILLRIKIGKRIAYVYRFINIINNSVI